MTLTLLILNKHDYICELISGAVTAIVFKQPQDLSSRL